MWKSSKAGYRYSSEPGAPEPRRFLRGMEWEPDLRGDLLVSGAEKILSGKARRPFGAKRQDEKFASRESGETG